MDVFNSIPRTPEPSIAFDERTPDTRLVKEEGKSRLNQGKRKDHSEFIEAIQSLQNWDSKRKSGIVLALIALVFFLTHGSGGFHVVSLISIVLLTRVAVLFVFGNILEALVSRNDSRMEHLVRLIGSAESAADNLLLLPKPESVSNVIFGVANIVESRVNKFTVYMQKATEPSEERTKNFRGVCVHLIAPIALFHFVNLYTALLLWAMYRMTWPVFYKNHQERVDTLYGTFVDRVTPLVATMDAKFQKLATPAKKKSEAVLNRVSGAMQPMVKMSVDQLNKVLSPGRAKED